MKYLRIKNNIVEYPYPIEQLYAANPNVSFPDSISDKILEFYGLHKVLEPKMPIFDSKTQIAERNENPTKVEKVWTLEWIVRNKTQQEIDLETADVLPMLITSRAEAYRSEADPMFFKAQRGEATMDEWLALVAEIKMRYPYS